MSADLRRKLLLYQVTTIIGVMFALVGFSYNVWRMEITEANNNTRTACFEILTELATLEQLIYIAHYDRDPVEGSPRKAWVQVGLVRDLSTLTPKPIEARADALHAIWSEHWDSVTGSEASVRIVIAAIDAVRVQIKTVLRSLD